VHQTNTRDVSTSEPDSREKGGGGDVRNRGKTGSTPPNPAEFDSALLADERVNRNRNHGSFGMLRVRREAVDHCGDVVVEITGLVSAGDTADLRHLSTAPHTRFDEVVRVGLDEPPGMPRFDEELNREQSESIQAYIIEPVHKDLLAREDNSPWRNVEQGFPSPLA